MHTLRRRHGTAYGRIMPTVTADCRRYQIICASGPLTASSRGSGTRIPAFASAFRGFDPSRILPSFRRIGCRRADQACFGRPRRCTRIVAPAHSKATQMAIQAPSRIRVRCAVAALWAVCVFYAVAHAASPVPDGVSLSESTVTWSTVNYATDAENGFVSGSLDKKTIVDRTFRPHVPGCRARQDVAEAVGFQGGEGECR